MLGNGHMVMVPVNIQTDTTENITFPTTLAGGKN